jgi:hypothetical protein
MPVSICRRELEREAVSRLPRLAARNCYLERCDIDGGRVVNLMSPRNDHAAPVAKWSRDLVDAFHRQGWVEQDPLGRTILSAGGRAWLAGRGVKRGVAQNGRRLPGKRPGKQAGGDSTGGEAGNLAIVVDDAESPLAWLASRKGPDGRPLLTQQMFDAGERLRRDFEAGQMSQRVTAQWGASIMPGARGRSGLPGQALSQTEQALAARQRVWNALQHAGPGLSSVLLEVCCLASGLEAAERHLKWPKRSAKLVLLIALERLVQHYGYDGNASVRSHQPLQMWGAEDYRPELLGHLREASGGTEC